MKEKKVFPFSFNIFSHLYSQGVPSRNDESSDDTSSKCTISPAESDSKTKGEPMETASATARKAGVSIEYSSAVTGTPAAAPVPARTASPSPEMLSIQWAETKASKADPGPSVIRGAPEEALVSKIGPVSAATNAAVLTQPSSGATMTAATTEYPIAEASAVESGKSSSKTSSLPVAAPKLQAATTAAELSPIPEPAVAATITATASAAETEAGELSSTAPKIQAATPTADISLISEPPAAATAATAAIAATAAAESSTAEAEASSSAPKIQAATPTAEASPVSELPAEPIPPIPSPNTIFPACGEDPKLNKPAEQNVEGKCRAIQVDGGSRVNNSIPAAAVSEPVDRDSKTFSWQSEMKAITEEKILPNDEKDENLSSATCKAELCDEIKDRQDPIGSLKIDLIQRISESVLNRVKGAQKEAEIKQMVAAEVRQEMMRHLAGLKMDPPATDVKLNVLRQTSPEMEADSTMNIVAKETDIEDPVDKQQEEQGNSISESNDPPSSCILAEGGTSPTLGEKEKLNLIVTSS